VACHIRTSLPFLRPPVSELHLFSILSGNGGTGAAVWSVPTATNGAQVAWGAPTVYQEWVLQPV
jgi:hypothetical protein